MLFKARKVMPVYKPAVRSLCTKRYPGHPHGCPNFGTRPTCPPDAPFLPLFFDTARPIWALWVDFNLEQWVAEKKIQHPEWSYKQQANLRYWQPKARKFLHEYSRRWMAGYAKGLDSRTIERQGIEYSDCPEAMGVDVTSTMKRIGVTLEWPPKKIVRKIFLLGVRLR
jgi:predicted metal-binding protein